MKRLAVLAALLLVGCSHLVRRSEAPKEPNTDGILQLIGRFGSAHGCPISETLALTNAHVTDERPWDGAVPYYPYVWSAGDKGEGVLWPIKEMVFQYRDLALMKSSTPFPSWYAIAKTAPKVGDKLWLTEYDFDSPDKDFAEKRLTVTVKRVVARNVSFVQGGHQGSSGSCILNADGEIVAINAWLIGHGDKGSSGVGVGIWGESFLPVEPKAITLEELLGGS